jgi:hypothetical protein
MINTEAVSSPIEMNYPLIYGLHLPSFLLPLLFIAAISRYFELFNQTGCFRDEKIQAVYE